MHKNNDNKLKRKVQDAINADPEMERYGVQADVIDGEVQLTGIVDTMAEKKRLNEIVSRVPGVKRIENGITISTDGQINDDGVVMEVTEELNADPRVQLKNIGVKSVDGRVFLVGCSEDPGEEQAAVEAASKARGVKEVVSHVKHKKAEDLGAETIFHSQVRNDKDE
ncbi:MAG: BON domain-containing protein [Desulfotomaculum sp.]|nr:BON domain-containing protein [Desulfotomaculum sp.]